MRMLAVCLGLAKRLLPALLALGLLAGPTVAHPAQKILSAGPLAAAALAHADHDQHAGCAQQAMRLHCAVSGCAQLAETSEQPCPVRPISGQPVLARNPRLGSLNSSPALQPPILAASA